MGFENQWFSHPRKFGPGSRSCRVCSNHHGLIRKYGLNMMVVKRVKAGKPKRVVKKTVVKKAPKEVDDSKKRVSFAKKLTHSKIIEEDVNVSQNFDVTPSKGILKTRKRVADAEPETRPQAKTKPQTSDKENPYSKVS
uniref:Small ribosomal subunit protein uS14 n=1 Tax=Panagrolaimus davidi TaxID=227884 RepID=A0A914PKH0_9BILA